MKALLALLFAGKLGKVFLTGGTMLLSLFVYATTYGWPYAVGIVAMLFFHEGGHYIAARQRGLNVGAPTFIPFVGAWIDLKEQPMDSETEAFVGIAGPMVGSIAAFICYGLAQSESSRMLMAIAYSGFILNLFNLIPILPLDGGRIVGVISPKIWFIGIPMLMALFLWKPSPMLILIAVIAIPQVWSIYKNKAALASSYYRAPMTVKLTYSFQYLSLASFLAVMAFDVHSRLHPS